MDGGWIQWTVGSWLDVCTLLAFFLVVCHFCDIMLIVFFLNYYFGNFYFYFLCVNFQFLKSSCKFLFFSFFYILEINISDPITILFFQQHCVA